MLAQWLPYNRKKKFAIINFPCDTNMQAFINWFTIAPTSSNIVIIIITMWSNQQVVANGPQLLRRAQKAKIQPFYYLYFPRTLLKGNKRNIQISYGISQPVVSNGPQLLSRAPHNFYTGMQS
ncbi:hypothetical protein GOP47_0005676 [Adiantum capillus-veneris]|uniref:Uncharacterized protein n=1 Tax=Adiantum capillus-veneris TaxID=13818 RepID=A0A9D4ZNH0_ADICA|nr:hypothetical protein GOP47_0005676 [Adiantum capillus-veneris]